MKHAITIFAAALLALLPMAAPAQNGSDPLAPVAMLAGDWTGTGEGDPGTSAAFRHAARAHEGHYLRIEGRSVYPRQDKNKKGEMHTQTDWWSYDKAQQRLILRQFDNLGFVSTYAQDLAASRPGHIVLVSVQLENVPAGWKARYTYDLIGDDAFEERFELDPDGKGFQPYTFNRFLRDRPD
ncbi:MULTISPECIES: heme-binding beta-barrel domain-containing protein [unclassified Sphingomonas]|uniref:heme-binding beta-barrel domain-containing protein n=1 Tax=Sphingomonas TaxID=13687 RepID=UPI00095D17FF|nr:MULTISPECIES: heme-binding beta-barrel domain-containing protein [unclassified Sphingomonas]MBN8812314.1 FABP family protein [Sphingomonas sp.]OJY48009.1 MAG: hypothetical protein BGP17_02350 [Sphingomonas sp. 67-41]